MTNQLTTFDFNALPVRVVERDGEPWFVAADVCKALGLDNPSYVTKRLGEDEKASFKLPNQRGSAAKIISESGLYKLIMRSDKPEARAFQDWVTKVVLPAIRQDAEGRYCLNDLHKAAVAAGANKRTKEPGKWMANASFTELVEELTTQNPGSFPVTTIEGRNGGTFVVKELVYAYAMWISPAFHLKVIRANAR